MRTRRGFTLIELLLVLAIIGVVMVVAFPVMVQSIKGHRLRAGLRSVVMAGSYARSMAILRQEPVSLEFDLGQGAFRVDESGATASAPAGRETELEANAGADARLQPLLERGDDELRGSASTNGSATAYEPIERTLEGVRILYVTLEYDERTVREGKASILYRTNGTCTPYSLKLRGKDGTWGTIEVDVLGAVETKTGMERVDDDDEV